MGEYYKAASVEDACRELRGSAGTTTVIAGGQELMLDIREGQTDPTRLVDISEIGTLQTVSEVDNRIEIGACVTYSDVEASPVLAETVPSFVDAVTDIAGPQVRNNGTLGGALCDADPVFDAPPVLLTLDATVEATDGNGSRRIPVSEFFTGRFETALDPGEILTRVTFPRPSEQSAGTYRSMTPRQGDSTVVGVAVRLELDDESVCTTARVGLTNAGDVPLRPRSVETALEGTTVDDGAIDRAVDALRSEIDLPDGTAHSERYRERVLGRLTEQAVRETREKLEGDR